MFQNFHLDDYNYNIYIYIWDLCRFKDIIDLMN